MKVAGTRVETADDDARSRTLIVSDLHVPDSNSDKPRRDRVQTECWFAAWAVANLPEETVVLNSHSAPQTPVSRLAKYLQSPACKALAD